MYIVLFIRWCTVPRTYLVNLSFLNPGLSFVNDSFLIKSHIKIERTTTNALYYLPRDLVLNEVVISHILWAEGPPGPRTMVDLTYHGFVFMQTVDRMRVLSIILLVGSFELVSSLLASA